MQCCRRSCIKIWVASAWLTFTFLCVCEIVSLLQNSDSCLVLPLVLVEKSTPIWINGPVFGLVACIFSSPNSSSFDGQLFARYLFTFVSFFATLFMASQLPTRWCDAIVILIGVILSLLLRLLLRNAFVSLVFTHVNRINDCRTLMSSLVVILVSLLLYLTVFWALTGSSTH